MVGGPSKIGQQGGGWGINQGCGGQNMVITGPCYPLVRLNIRGAAYIRAFKGPGSPASQNPGHSQGEERDPLVIECGISLLLSSFATFTSCRGYPRKDDSKEGKYWLKA